MKELFRSLLLTFVLLLLTLQNLSAKPIKLEMWHALEGFINDRLVELVGKFNHSQDQYVVNLTRKGNYTETYKAGVEAVKDKKNPPHILQVYEIATPTFLTQKDLYIPAHELLKNYGYAFPEGLFPAIIAFYSDDQDQLMGLPFNVSTGLLYYNTEAFEKAGLKESPTTWEDVEAYAEKLKKAGFSCALTTAWPSGYLLEHFGARHNVPFATDDNGFTGENPKLLVSAEPFLYNIGKFAEWQQKGIFQYSGRFVQEPEKLFTSGKCAMILQGTSRLVMLQKPADFKVSVGPLPYWKVLTKEPHNLVTGGAALWAIKGHDEVHEKGVAEFFNFIAQPENQQFWAEMTGYMPLSKAAYQLIKKSGYYDKNPQAHIGIESLMLSPTAYSKGLRIPGFIDVREALIDAMEAVFEKQRPANKALDQAVQIGNGFIQKASSETKYRNQGL